MHKIWSDEIVGTTFYTINKIRELKNWWDVLILYFSYIEQSRIQETNRSWSLDTFMQEKMGWGKERFYNVKNELKKLWLIDVIQVRDTNWVIQTWYVKTNFLINEEKIRTSWITYEIDSTLLGTQTPGNPDSGKQDTNALSTKNKCLKKEEKIILPPPPKKEKYTYEEFKELNEKEESKYLNTEMMRALEYMVELWYTIREKPDKMYDWFRNTIKTYFGMNEQWSLMMTNFREETFKRYMYHKEKWDKITLYKTSIMKRFWNYLSYKKQ